MKSLEQFIRLYENGQRFVVFDVETVDRPTLSWWSKSGPWKQAGNLPRILPTFKKVLRFRPSSWQKYWRELGIHGIPPHEIENGEDRTSVLKEFLAFIDGARLICHTNYDIHAMKAQFTSASGISLRLESPVWSDYTDSCKLARKICPELPSFFIGQLVAPFWNH